MYVSLLQKTSRRKVLIGLGGILAISALAACQAAAPASPTTAAEPTKAAAPAPTTAPAAPAPTIAPKVAASSATTSDTVDAIDLAGKNIEVVYWHNRPQKDQDLLQSMLDEFSKTNPYGVKARAEIAGASYNDIYNKVSAAIQAGQPPDISVAYQNQAAFYRAQGAVIDLPTSQSRRPKQAWRPHFREVRASATQSRDQSIQTTTAQSSQARAIRT